MILKLITGNKKEIIDVVSYEVIREDDLKLIITDINGMRRISIHNSYSDFNVTIYNDNLDMWYVV